MADFQIKSPTGQFLTFRSSLNTPPSEIEIDEAFAKFKPATTTFAKPVTPAPFSGLKSFAKNLFDYGIKYPAVESLRGINTGVQRLIAEPTAKLEEITNRKAIENVNKLYPGLLRPEEQRRPFQRIAELAKKATEAVPKTPLTEKLSGKIYGALGESIPAAASFALPQKFMGTAPAMASVSAFQHIGEGKSAMAKAAIKGAALGGVMHGAAYLPLLARFPTLGAVFAGQTAIEGGSPQDILAQGFTGAILGLPGRIGKLSEVTRPIKINLAQQTFDTLKNDPSVSTAQLMKAMRFTSENIDQASVPGMLKGLQKAKARVAETAEVARQRGYTRTMEDVALADKTITPQERAVVMGTLAKYREREQSIRLDPRPSARDLTENIQRIELKNHDQTNPETGEVLQLAEPLTVDEVMQAEQAKVDLEQGNHKPDLETITSEAGKEIAENLKKHQKEVKRLRGKELVAYELQKANEGRTLEPDEIYAQEFATKNYDSAYQNYINETQKEFGVSNIVSSDVGKFAIPGMSDKMSATYHESGSALSKAHTANLLDDPVVASKPALIFAGGSGSGKTSILKSILGREEARSNYGLIHDTNLNSFAPAKKKIDDLLEKGVKEIDVMFVYRDPVVAWIEGVIKRAAKGERMVPIDAHVSTHLGSPENMPLLLKTYPKNIKLLGVENLGSSSAEAKRVPFDKMAIKEYTPKELEDILYDETVKALQSGRISKGAFDVAISLSPRLKTRYETEGLPRAVVRLGPPATPGVSRPTDQIVPRKAVREIVRKIKEPTPKEKLIQEIDQAIKEAPAKSEMGEAVIAFGYSKKTFQVAGAEMKIINTKEALTEFKTRIEKGVRLFPGAKKRIERMKLTSELGFIRPEVLSPSMWINALDKVWYSALGKKLEGAFFGGLDKITPEIIKRNLVEGYGQPVSYQKLQDYLNAERALNAEKVRDLTAEMTKLKPGEIKNIRKIIESGDYPDTNVGRLAKKIEDTFFDLGEQMVKYGLLKPNQFAKYASRYFPYYYKIFETDGKIGRWFGRRLDLSYARSRKEMPEEIRQAMGIIDDTPEPVARKMISEMGDVALQKFFMAVSQNPELSSPTPLGKFVQMPKSKKLGTLSEQYVHPAIHSDLTDMIYSPQTAEKIWTGALGLWKTGKVVLNPPTVGRNIITNFFMADILGNVSPTNLVAWAQGGKSLKTKDKFYQELRAQGKIGVEFYRQEIDELISNFNAKSHPVVAALEVLKKAGNYYSALEEWSKVTIYRYNREQGMSIEEAAKLAEEAIFNYSKVAPIVKQLRMGTQRGPLGPFGTILASPFITFKAKALKGLSHAAFKKPFTLLKYYLLFSMIGAMAQKTLQVSDEELKKMKKDIEERGRVGLLTPFTGKDGEYYFLDLTFMLPIVGDFFEMRAKIKHRGVISATQSSLGIFGSPFITIPSQILANKNFYTQREIVNRFDSPMERTAKIFHFTYQQVVPPLSPYGAGWDILKGQDIPRATISTLGLRLMPYSYEEEIDRQARQAKGLKFEYNLTKGRIRKDEKLNPDQRVRKIVRLTESYSEKLSELYT